MSETVMVSLVGLVAAVMGHISSHALGSNAGAIALLGEYRSTFSDLKKELKDCQQDRDQLLSVVLKIAEHTVPPETLRNILAPGIRIERVMDDGIKN